MKPIVEIEGFKELEQKIIALDNDKQKKNEIIKILRLQAQSTVVVAKQNAPISPKPHLSSGKRTKQMIQPGNLRDSIGVIIPRKSENPTVAVGPIAKGSKNGFYGSWVEYGHNIYSNSKKRIHKASAKIYNNSIAKSKTKAQLFMKKTYEEVQGVVSQELEMKVAKAIQRSINRLSSK